jgi:hypothetical protein
LRVIVEAKFHKNPNDTDIGASSLVAELAVRLRDCLKQIQIDKEGAAGQRRWDEWLAMTPARTEWGAAKAHAVRMWRAHWPRWNDEDRRSVIAALFTPFIVTPEMIATFAGEIEQAW